MRTPPAGRRRWLPLLLAAGLALAAPVPASAAPVPVVTPSTAPLADEPAANCQLPDVGRFLHEGPTNWNTFTKPVGAHRALMLFRGYSQAAAQDQYNQMRSIEDFYAKASFGRYQLTLVPYYGNAGAAPEGIAPPDLLGDVARPGQRAASVWGTAARFVDPVVDFSNIDFVFVVDARQGRSFAEGEEVTLDGHRLHWGVAAGSDWAGYRAMLLAHEHGHTLSLPDEYGGAGGFEYTGGWGVMGNLGGPSPDLFAWEKRKVGWLDDAQLACVSQFNSGIEKTLSPVETAGGTKAITIRYSNTRAYVAEVRARAGADPNTCAPGVLVYRVDSAVESSNGPVRVFDSRPNSGGCGGIRHELNDGTYQAGQTWTDSATGVRFTVVSQSGDNYVVRGTYGTANPQPAVFADDFETNKGWTVDAAGTDTATSGRWARGNPGGTSYNGTVCQRDDTPSGSNALVTDPAGGVDCGVADVDGGATTVTSPPIALPAGVACVLTFRGYLAHLDNATAADRLRIRINGAVVYERAGSASVLAAAWQQSTVNLAPYAGQTVRIVVEAVDGDGGSMVEAAVDDVAVTRS
ncbi:hypothetical protein [Longispora urticae]